MAACTLDFMKKIVISKISANDSELCHTSHPSKPFWSWTWTKWKRNKEESRNLGLSSVQNGYVTSKSSTLKGSSCNQCWGDAVSKTRPRSTILIHRFRGLGFEHPLLPSPVNGFSLNVTLLLKLQFPFLSSSFNSCSFGSCSKTALSKSPPPD